MTYTKWDMQEIPDPHTPDLELVLARDVDAVALVAEAEVRAVVDAHDGVSGIVDEREIPLRRVGRGDILDVAVC